ncbi:MAG TPA: phosphate ABC transporter permease PstA [Anaerolineales bacterium]|nr:phosphate ABC transporter permease PstA [Anaerolineales bacterium]
MSPTDDPQTEARPEKNRDSSIMLDRFQFSSNLARRHRLGRIWLVLLRFSTLVGILALTALIASIINDSFGYAAIQYKVDPNSLTAQGTPLSELSCEELIPILEENLSTNRFRQLISEKPLAQWSQEECYETVLAEVAKPKILETWSLVYSLRYKDLLKVYTEQKYPGSELVFKTWLNRDFIDSPQSSDPLLAGIRTAILGSLFVIAIVIVVAFPIGIAAAIYLEEYATPNRINGIIQTNINNLAGVPSIIYGMLGLTFFVRILEPLTSGSVFGYSDPTTANGRTILAAGLTLALLILPVIIINSQEAIRAVPGSLREASYGMGATRWQTVWHHVLPYALPGILTGTILSVSRAFGETAPLVVVGASTFVRFDPDSIFSKFTTIPIQIYQWTARPQDAYKNIAAAAIIVLLLLLLTLNATAIFLRNRFSRRLV